MFIEFWVAAIGGGSLAAFACVRSFQCAKAGLRDRLFEETVGWLGLAFVCLLALAVIVWGVRESFILT